MKDGETCSTGSDKGACGEMGLKQKVPMVAGGLIILTTILGFSAPFFHWLTIAIGGLMVYAGISGNCMITKMLCMVCPKCKAEVEEGKDGKTS